MMTASNPDPFEVALVHAAGTLLVFLFALPDGALADTIDRCRLLMIVMQSVAGDRAGPHAEATAFRRDRALGMAAPCWLNALSNVAVIGALICWRGTRTAKPRLPSEHLRAAMRSGLGNASLAQRRVAIMANVVLRTVLPPRQGPCPLHRPATEA
jgi:hypothetical protein